MQPLQNFIHLALPDFIECGIEEPTFMANIFMKNVT